MQSTKMASKSGCAASETCSMRRAMVSARAALGLGDQRELRAQRGRVADVADLRFREIGRDEPDAQRAPHREVVAEAAREHQLLHLLGPDARDVPEHGHAGGDGALAELHLPDVVLGEHDLPLRAVLAGAREHDHALLAAHLDARAHGGGEPVAPVHVDEPGPVHHAQIEQRGHRVHEAGAAEALGRAVADGVQAEVAVLDAHAVDGADGAAHAVADLGALERGAGGGRARPQPVARAQQDLAVGPDVHRDAERGGLVDAGGERHRHRVRAHEAGHDGQQAHARLGGQLEEEIARGQRERVPHHRRVGGEAHVGGIDAEQQVVHAGVAHDHHLVDPLGEDARLARDLLDVLVEQADDARLQLAEVARVELGEGDARHQVAAEDRLRVQARRRRELLAGLELHERGHHAGGPDVDGEAELVQRGVARLHRENLPAERGHGDLAAALAQRRGQGLEHRGRDVLDRRPRSRRAAPPGRRSGGARPWAGSPGPRACGRPRRSRSARARRPGARRPGSGRSCRRAAARSAR